MVICFVNNGVSDFIRYFRHNQFDAFYLDLDGMRVFVKFNILAGQSLHVENGHSAQDIHK